MRQLSRIIGSKTSSEVAQWCQKKEEGKRIRSLGENLPWRHPGKAIKMKTSLRHPSCFQKNIYKKKKFYCIAGLQEDYREQKKVTLTFIPASISYSPHLPPSFLASLSPHYTSSSKTVFSTGGSVFSTGGSKRNYREPKVSIRGSLRDEKSFMRNL